MIQFIKNNLLWKDGKYIAILLSILSIVSLFFFKPLLLIILPIFFFCLYFFRNPERICFELFSDDSILVCPADGKVVDISKENIENYAQKVSIFLSPLDVHVNWLPTYGKIKEINYRPGKFIVAYAPKSSELNERNDIIIENNKGQILVRQIAGFAARRICCWVETCDSVEAGQKFGMIRFGSRVDILFPSNVKISVKIGQKVKGGETILGRWL